MATRYTKEKREARRQLGLRVAAERTERSRYYISFSFRPARTYRGRYGITAYVKGVWPILFRTEAEAWEAIRILPVFTNAGHMPGRGRIVSCSVERTEIRPRATA